jgi:long-chain acyl-CoA synthetase
MTEWSEDIIPAEQAGTLDGLFFERVRRTPEGVAYRSYDTGAGDWLETRWREMAEEVSRWEQAIEGEGLKAGERVAVLLRNGEEWVAFDQAALAAGLVVVPLYTDDRPDNIAYILKDSATRVLLIQDIGRWRRLAPALKGNDHLKRVLVLANPRQGDKPTDERVRFVNEWKAATARPLRRRDGDGHQLASIVYTSGTTGRPKGVMLSHQNMLSVAHGAIGMLDVYQQDVFLSFLPLSHTLERTAGYYLPIMSGSTVVYARSVAQLADDLMRVKPTVLIAVPRIFERVYGRIEEGLAKQGALPRALFRLTVDTGWRAFERRQGRAGWHPSLLLWPLLKRMVGEKVTARLGGRVRAAVSGGAALPLPVARTFIGLGLNILQGYGLTETAPVISVNTFDDNEPASVGLPLRSLEVKVGEDDELLVKGPGVMLGYWNNHAATRAAIDPQGWLHTGDQARIEHGHIYITGRIKDILVLSNGEKVPPGDMESAITLDPLVDQALVLGEGKSYLAALLVLNRDAWFGLARELGLDPYAEESLRDERLENRVVARLRRALHDFPGYAKIRRVGLTLEPWTVESGLMTPTMKLKRAQVLEHHATLVNALYQHP